MVVEALRRFADEAGEHGTALETYLASIGGSAVGRADSAAASAAVPSRAGSDTSTALAEAYGVLNVAAFRYGALTTMAFRLYELPLRELAPKHLRDYAQAAHAINQLIPADGGHGAARAGSRLSVHLPNVQFRRLRLRGCLDAAHQHCLARCRPARGRAGPAPPAAAPGQRSRPRRLPRRRALAGGGRPADPRVPRLN